MIPFTSQRANGEDLSDHLHNEADNDSVIQHDLRGSIGRTLREAFKEWKVQAETLTRCKEYLYSMSINPDPKQGPLTRAQYMDYIGRVEKALGLTDQPRAIVFHVKYGREHCHVVWSRIDVEKGRAVQLGHDKFKLMDVTRAFARDHHLKLPAGYYKANGRGQETLYERELKRQSGLSKEDHERQVTEACAHSDSPKAFVRALADRGYLLAAGTRRTYVLVDLYGGIHSLSRRIKDRNLKSGILQSLERDIPPSELPSIEEAQDLVAKHRAYAEQSNRDHIESHLLQVLEHSQAERRNNVSKASRVLSDQQRQVRRDMEVRHRQERRLIKIDHLAHRKAIRLARMGGRPDGLAAFLGKATGITAIRKAIHRYQDGKLISGQRLKRKELLAKQVEDIQATELRLGLQARDMARRLRQLEALEKRERAAVLRDGLREAREREREGQDFIPSVAELMTFKEKKRPRMRNLLQEFLSSVGERPRSIPNLSDAFFNASQPKDGRDGGDNGGIVRDPGHSPDGQGR